jgi:hypothetical protein
MVASRSLSSSRGRRTAWSERLHRAHPQSSEKAYERERSCLCGAARPLYCEPHQCPDTACCRMGAANHRDWAVAIRSLSRPPSMPRSEARQSRRAKATTRRSSRNSCCSPPRRDRSTNLAAIDRAEVSSHVGVVAQNVMRTFNGALSHRSDGKRKQPDHV